MTENWKPVAGWEKLYEVSDLGRVRSLDRISRFKENSKIIDVAFKGKLLKPSIVGGYFYMHLRNLKRKRYCGVHRLVLETFVGPCPKDQQARHLDGIRPNCALSNLAWGTKLENEKDRIKHGRVPRGRTQHHAKLTDENVKAIRAFFAANGHRRGLAALWRQPSDNL
jgi:hypothetical protein